MDEEDRVFANNWLSHQTRRGALCASEQASAHCEHPSTRHPERASARRSFGSVAKRNGQNQALQRAGIYEEVFVTFHRQSYFTCKPVGASPRPTLSKTVQPRLPLSREGDHEVVVGEFQKQSYFPTNAGARSAPLRRLCAAQDPSVALLPRG